MAAGNETHGSPASGSDLYNEARELAISAGFVELAPSFVDTPDEFLSRLQTVPGVTKAEWKSFCKRNIFVTSLRMGPDPVSHLLEFELTPVSHLLELTRTVSFKEPSPDLLPEAWRILRNVTKGNELFPDHTHKCHMHALDRWVKFQLNVWFQDHVSFQGLSFGSRTTSGSSQDSRAVPGSASTAADYVAPPGNSQGGLHPGHASQNYGIPEEF